MRNFHDLNEALLFLLPKTTNTSLVNDYRSVALIHTFDKFISKVLTSRLTLRLGELV
jgi:hypothetical protein